MEMNNKINAITIDFKKNPSRKLAFTIALELEQTRDLPVLCSNVMALYRNFLHLCIVIIQDKAGTIYAKYPDFSPEY